MPSNAPNRTEPQPAGPGPDGGPAYSSFASPPTQSGAGRSGGGLGRIDQYELLSRLGGGGFGVVYLARDTVSGAQVALKTLHPLLRGSAEEMERVRSNFATVSRLHHANIASALVLHVVRDVVCDDAARRDLHVAPGDTVVLMTYAPGATLSRWRRQFPGGKVPFGQALEICSQVADALDYAHANQVVHRDVKPSNVAVDEREGQILATVLDFGLAAEIRASMSRVSSETGNTSGTRPYMAPEQWAGRRQDGRTDQYALACLFYELVSGAVPFANVFDTGDPLVMERAVLGRKPDPVAGIPRHANAALLKALAKDPGRRFPTCRAFIRALAGETPGRVAARRALLALSLFVLAGVGAAVAAWLVSRQPPLPPIGPFPQGREGPAPAGDAAPAEADAPPGGASQEAVREALASAEPRDDAPAATNAVPAPASDEARIAEAAQEAAREALAKAEEERAARRAAFFVLRDAAKEAKAAAEAAREEAFNLKALSDPDAFVLMREAREAMGKADWLVLDGKFEEATPSYKEAEANYRAARVLAARAQKADEPPPEPPAPDTRSRRPTSHRGK